MHIYKFTNDNGPDSAVAACDLNARQDNLLNAESLSTYELDTQTIVVAWRVRGQQTNRRVHVDNGCNEAFVICVADDGPGGYRDARCPGPIVQCHKCHMYQSRA